MLKHGSGDTHVLVIPSSLESDLEAAYGSLSSESQKAYTFYGIRPVPKNTEEKTIDYKTLLEQCRKVIREENIAVLYASRHNANMVLAILCRDFSHLKGPNVESVFLCSHNYYTSVVIDSRSERLPHEVALVEGDLYDLTYKILTNFRAPCIIRACLGSGHSVYCCHNRDNLLKVLMRCQKNISVIINVQRWLLDNFIDQKKYPLATKPVILLNSYLNRFQAVAGATWTNVNVEACVFRGEFIRWSICDAVNLPYRNVDATSSFSGLEMPTHLTPKQQAQLWTDFRSDVQKLIQKGFDNSFVFAEYMVFEDCYNHLVTMNGHPTVNCTTMYKRALHNGNNIKATLQLRMGVRPVPPTLNGTYVLNYTMVVFEACKIDSLIRFSKASKNPDVLLHYKPGQEVVIEPAKDFAVIGCITIDGENFEECLEKVKHTRAIILKVPEMVPLTS